MIFVDPLGLRSTISRIWQAGTGVMAVAGGIGTAIIAGGTSFGIGAAVVLAGGAGVSVTWGVGNIVAAFAPDTMTTEATMMANSAKGPISATLSPFGAGPQNFGAMADAFLSPTETMTQAAAFAAKFSGAAAKSFAPFFESIQGFVDQNNPAKEEGCGK